MQIDVAHNINELKKELPQHVKLIPVSKTKPNEMLMQAYDGGNRVFGENKVQELTAKQEELPKDIEWHFIGHLQSNKVKYIAPFVSLIHGVDKLKLLKEINKRARQNERVQDVLLQFHIAKEESKFGLDLNEARELLNSDQYKGFENVRVVGVMGMATFTENMETIRSEFKALKSIFDTLKSEFFASDDSFKEVSMGMSNDYKIAIEEGSTMIRIGSSLFGARN